MHTRKVAVLLHNIRSAHNVGSVFRTADGAGASLVVLSGYSPLPIDRFGRPQKDIAKTALGAEKFVPWRAFSDVKSAIESLRTEGYAIVGLEQDPRAADYRAYRSEDDVALVLGNEVRGLSKGLRDACDALIEIPMHGKKESLNVSVAAGIALFALSS